MYTNVYTYEYTHVHSCTQIYVDLYMYAAIMSKFLTIHLLSDV